MACVGVRVERTVRHQRPCLKVNFIFGAVSLSNEHPSFTGTRHSCHITGAVRRPKGACNFYANRHIKLLLEHKTKIAGGASV
jgi:hypothetical protein